jgi:hypothetical protein
VDLIERIEHLLESTMNAVKGAAEKCDVPALQQLTRRSQRLNELKHCVSTVDQELRDIESDASAEDASRKQDREIQSQNVSGRLLLDTTVVPRQSDVRQMIIEVTQGMINQNLLTLTAHVQAGRIRPGAEMRIEVRPSGELFRTDLLSNGNRLRERGAIARFYRDARVRAGDCVVLTRESPDRWILEKLQSGLAPIPPTSRATDDQI